MRTQMVCLLDKSLPDGDSLFFLSLEDENYFKNDYPDEESSDDEDGWCSMSLCLRRATDLCHRTLFIG